ncbi:ABC superfamily ATP binding cassette transporter, ABC protein [Lactobacillus selangorensis]|uniref:ABC superfamily ATP binding cassette transporter, ABC protein n=1 Tax=Lactobacillus selangorensis TaxID=81857 RepID=A0A0R2FQ94_9LACO|nr:ATP-binding cassette domain-containing protein [Lactobacillus selangorensis]KRN27904.1 ABC superfamily ATP binding cassette transporter, ABC protein [Lactobacillus selangorensis]KRN30625.1 ABC superfamily ATP binding cassette transporter, ABC protein [Lactobacillus selangorensis]
MGTILQLDHVSYTADKSQILSDISFSVAEQEYLTISGPSGSGKSTLLRVISSLITQTSGTVNFKGKSSLDYDPTEYRRHVSYCFQQPQLFGNTVKDNLTFPFEIRNQPFDQKKATDSLQYVGLSAGDLDKNINALSGGEKQRVALIRNVLFPPDILLADEVTAGLDDTSKEIVHKLLKHLNQDRKMTLISVTHDDSEIRDAAKLYNIVAGKLEVPTNDQQQ